MRAAVERTWNKKVKAGFWFSFQVKLQKTFQIAPSPVEANAVFDPGEAKIVRHEENMGVFSRDDFFQVVMLGKRHTFVTTLERNRNWSHQIGETK